MKKTKPTVAAAAIPKNLCQKHLPNLQNGRKQRLRSSPGYAEEPCKTKKTKPAEQPRVFRKTFPQEPFKREEPGVCRGTFQNMKKTSLTSSRGYSDEPSKTWRKHEKAKAKLRISPGYSEKPSPTGTFQTSKYQKTKAMEQPRVCRGTFQKHEENET